MEGEVRQLTAYKTRISVTLNVCKFLAIEKALELLCKWISIKSFTSEFVYFYRKTSERKGKGHILEKPNQEML